MTDDSKRTTTPGARVIASYPKAYCALVSHPGQGYRVWDGAVDTRYTSRSPSLSGWHRTARKAWEEAAALIERDGQRR